MTFDLMADDITTSDSMADSLLDDMEDQVVDNIKIGTKLLNLLNDSTIGKRLTGISAFLSIVFGSMKIYNFCMEVNRRKMKNKDKILDLSHHVFVETSSDIIAHGMKDIMIKLDQITKSVNRYDHELNLLRKAQNESEEVFVYLRYLFCLCQGALITLAQMINCSTETYMPMTQSYSEYEKLKAEIRKLKGQMLSWRNFF